MLCKFLKLGISFKIFCQPTSAIIPFFIRREKPLEKHILLGCDKESFLRDL
jgi:hypothetical protein